MDQRAIEIRLAGEADIEALFDIRTSVSENHISRERLRELGITPASISQDILNAPCAWIAEIDGQSAGFSMVDHAEGSIFALFVRPAFEGRGLGRSLLIEAENALFRDHETLWLTTGAMTKAVGFYTKLGWSAVGTLVNGEQRFEKRRTLSPAAP